MTRWAVEAGRTGFGIADYDTMARRRDLLQKPLRQHSSALVSLAALIRGEPRLSMFMARLLLALSFVRRRPPDGSLAPGGVRDQLRLVRLRTALRQAESP